MPTINPGEPTSLGNWRGSGGETTAAGILALVLPTAVWSEAVAPDANGIVDFSLAGLEADTAYEYSLEADGTMVDAADVTFWWSGAIGSASARVVAKMAGTPASVLLVAEKQAGTFSVFGKFATPPVGAHTFSFVGGSCSTSASNHPVYDEMLAKSPDFYLMTGDLHYEDIATNDESLFRAAYEAEMTAKQRALYDVTPIVYVWDDHDYGPNDSDEDSVTRPAANAVYRQYVPSFDLEEVTIGVYHAFVRGRVRFIVSDLRSYKSPKGDTDDASKTMMGATQKQWFKDQIDNATEPVIVWVCTMPWIESTTAGSDSWGGYTTEREELANHIAASGKAGRIVVFSGDMHALAYDDGTNSDYASVGSAPMKVCHAAAIHRTGSTKGGPYTDGAFSNPDGTYGQFGEVSITDDGGASVTVAFTGYRVASDGTLTTPLAEKQWAINV